VTAPHIARSGTAQQSRQLVARFQDGDVDAYGQLYSRYRGEVYGFILRKVRVPDLAQDLTQDTFERALQYIGRWQWQGKDVGAWLLTIARNLVIDYFKSARNRLETIVEDPFAGGPGATVDGPEPAVTDHLRNVALLTALQHLTGEQRACLVHRFLRGLTMRETAAVMGCTDVAVRSMQYRAVRALSRHFAGRGLL